MKKKLLCAVMCCVLICGTFAPKKAYAVAGVDDAAVVIVCALLAAAGVTFASNDGVQDAVQGFLEDSAGRFDSTIERLASGYAVYGSVGAFKIPSMAMGGLRLLLEGLFDYFETDENRQGVIIIPSDSFYSFSSDVILYNDSYSSIESPYFFRIDYDKGLSPSIVLYLLNPSSDYMDVLAYRVSSSTWNSVSSVYVPGLRYDLPYAFQEFSSSPSYPRDMSFTFSNGSSTKSVTCNSRSLSRLLGWSDRCSIHFYPNLTLYSGDESLVADAYDFFFQNVDFNNLPVASGFEPVEKSIPYGLTFPQELSAPDVIDNFEQRVEAAAGDLAIVVPVDGVIDNTLPYAEAQEQYLANVNELGEITDTVMETNSWLSKILTAVKSIPAKVIGTGTLDFSGFQNIGLSSVFPFCIPFDLKNALVGFNVTPADPIWEISFEGTFMSAAGTYVLDMTKFEKLFAIVRFFIYGGFVVSLILLTRKIIKG